MAFLVEVIELMSRPNRFNANLALSRSYICKENCGVKLFFWHFKPVKSIFHQRMHLCWLSNARRREINNMKSMFPMPMLELLLSIVGSCWAL